MRIEERNGAIDICRFIYCLIIVGFHFYEETYEHFAISRVTPILRHYIRDVLHGDVWSLGSY